MKTKTLFKTKTIQSCSRVFLNKPEKQDNAALLSSIYEGLTKLGENLYKINYLIEKEMKERFLYKKRIEETGEIK